MSNGGRTPEGDSSGLSTQPGSSLEREEKSARASDDDVASGRGVAHEGMEDAAERSADAEEAHEELPPLVAVLEAALFASAEPVPVTRLTRVLGAWTRKQIAAGLEELAQRQEREGSGVRVVETAGGFQLRTVGDYAPWVRRFFMEKPPRLSRAVLETLAIVAYRQPATRGEIEAVRGVNCDAVLGALTARGLIQVLGRRQSPGRPVEYGTTQEFLELFSLRELADLPPLPEAASLASLIEEAREAEGEPGHTPVAGEGGSAADLEASAGAEGTFEGTGAPAGERDDAYGANDGATAEDPEPGRHRLAQIGGSADPGGAGSGEREGDPRAGGQG